MSSVWTNVANKKIPFKSYFLLDVQLCMLQH